MRNLSLWEVSCHVHRDSDRWDRSPTLFTCNMGFPTALILPSLVDTLRSPASYLHILIFAVTATLPPNPSCCLQPSASSGTLTLLPTKLTFRHLFHWHRPVTHHSLQPHITVPQPGWGLLAPLAVIHSRSSLGQKGTRYQCLLACLFLHKHSRPVQSSHGRFPASFPFCIAPLSPVYLTPFPPLYPIILQDLWGTRKLWKILRFLAMFQQVSLYIETCSPLISFPPLHPLYVVFQICLSILSYLSLCPVLLWVCRLHAATSLIPGLPGCALQ